MPIQHVGQPFTVPAGGAPLGQARRTRAWRRRAADAAPYVNM